MRLTLCAVALALVAAGAAAETYKWVDDQGRVHYSDSIPPEEAGKRREREVKSDSGMTIERIEPPPTRATLEARAQARARAEAQARAAAEQQERDNTLLRTYDSPEAMRRARDERIAVIEGRIKLARNRIERLEQRHQKLRERVAEMERSGRGDREGVYDEIRAVAEQVRAQRRFIERQRREIAQIRARFELDIQRYRELRADSPDRD